MKTLGVIGGLGPMATARLLTRIIEMTDAKTDQEHLDVIVFDRPQVPDRTAHLLHPEENPSPLPKLTETARTLEALGAELLCTPCVTAHSYFEALSGAVGVPLLHMVEETAEEALRCGVRRPAILATSGTVRIGLFQEAFSRRGVDCVLPGEDGQRLVMALIYDEIKTGLSPDPEKLRTVCGEVFSQGADGVILGCTELSLIPRDLLPAGKTLDALDVLARQAVLSAGGKLREEYKTLLF